MNPIDGLEEELEEISADTNFILISYQKKTVIYYNYQS